MDNRRHVRHDLGVVSGYNGHNEYQLVPTPIFAPPWSVAQKHPYPRRRIFLPSRIVHSIDDRTENHGLRVAPVTYVSGSSLAKVGDEPRDEAMDNVHSASTGDGAACAMTVEPVDDDDTRGDCSMVLVLHGNRNARPGNNFARGGKREVVDR